MADTSYQVDSCETLMSKANEYANRSTDDKMKEIIKYYFIARYCVSVFEARSHKLPIQVWNEYRNALDHYFRSLTLRNSEYHLKSMRGHIQRAILDIIKFLCTSEDDWYKDLQKSRVFDLLILIDNGNFIKHLTEMHQTAQDSMLDAKTYDLQLGTENSLDEEVVNKYLCAFFAYESLRRYYRSRYSAVSVNKLTYGYLITKDFILKILFSFFGKMLAALVIFGIGVYAAPWIDKPHHQQESVTSHVVTSPSLSSLTKC